MAMLGGAFNRCAAITGKRLFSPAPSRWLTTAARAPHRWAPSAPLQWPPGRWAPPRCQAAPGAAARRPTTYRSMRLQSSWAGPAAPQLRPAEAGPTAEAAAPALPRLTEPVVARYLWVVAGMVFTIVVVGGLTRLTESGLSITEWNLVSGTLPPLSESAWQAEFDKYKATPEWRLLNRHIDLDSFKYIYGWEWAHRALGRAIGLAFLLPVPFFIYRRALGRTTKWGLAAVGLLIGGQGALGWYMVKSGLDQAELDKRDGVPRVSQYRLAAHLGMAFAVYALCLRLAGGVMRDWKLARSGLGVGRSGSVSAALQHLHSPAARRMRLLVHGLTGLVFLTAISGAFVAGLDAGLLFNSFPLMGDRLIPPFADLFSPMYARNKATLSDLYWRNVLENPTTVQLDHRLLATLTLTCTAALHWLSTRPSLRPALPPATVSLLRGAFHMSLAQAALGITTLLYLVPTPVAALHQAGSLVLLTLSLAAGLTLRRPGAAAKVWLQRRRPAP